MNIVFRGEKMVWEQLKEELIFPKLEASNSKEAVSYTHLLSHDIHLFF